MADWNDGYVTEIEYTYGYYRELCPDYLDFMLLLRGIIPPVRTDDWAYCELGFGQGVSIGMHSAANPSCTVVGTDFNPAHAAFAQSLSRASGTSPRLYEDSFAELAARDDLPKFDYIVIHGIWTWVSRENHQIIVDFVRQQLKPGGVFYISYNALPGWAPMMPLRHMINRHAELVGTGSPVARLNGAIEFANSFFERKSLYSNMVPGAKARLEKIAASDRNYLAHEYLTQDWNLMYFTDMAKQLESAKLEFCCSTQVMESLESIIFPPEERQFLLGISNPILREQTKDYLINQQFRRDIYVRGPRKCDNVSSTQSMMDTKVILVTLAEEVSSKVSTPMGEVFLKEDTNKLLLDALASDNYRPKALRELPGADENFGSLIQAIAILLAGNNLFPCRSNAETVDAARPHCEKLNLHILSLTKGGTNIPWLVSPVTGMGFHVNSLHQFFLDACKNGTEPLPAELAKVAWESLKTVGQRMLKDGVALVTPEENIAELTASAEAFIRKLPIYRSLGIA